MDDPQVTLESRVLLRLEIMDQEGLELKPYKDPVGKLSIGYGRNLDDVGISKLEAEVLLDHDLASAEMECRKAFPWFPALSDVRQRVLVNMCFNLGLTKLKTFTRMLSALSQHDYALASREMLQSKWAEQVKGRALRLAKMMRDGR